MAKEHFFINSIKAWNSDDVFNWLINSNLIQFKEAFHSRNYTGVDLLKLTEDDVQSIIDDDIHLGDEDLKSMCATLVDLRGENPRQMNEVAASSSSSSDIVYTVDRKVLNDPIHGSIELHPLLIKIIDTPHFQRLRNIKQLGCAPFVFPSACHHRFEHSIGVCHLAGKLLRRLQTNQPELQIKEKDILCVEIAGLCHDLGHGPFSHMYDGRFIPAVSPGASWRHEDQSAKLFQHLIDTNPKVKDAFRVNDLNKQDVGFIKEQITGNGRVYREGKQAFLYEVVANKSNGIDVDKWDYFARDSYCLGMKSCFDHLRMMQYVRALNVRGQMQLCTRDKEAETLYDMFNTRRILHRRAYQHRVVVAVEIMLNESFLMANDHIRFYNKKGDAFSLSECKDDCEAYLTCTDDVYYVIRHSRDAQLERSRNIIERIESRDLYKCIGETRPKTGRIAKDQLKQFAEELVKSVRLEDLLGSQPLRPDDIVFHIIRLDYGMGVENPVDKVWFYAKHQPDIPLKLTRKQISSMLPVTFSEQILLAYCKRTDPVSLEMADKCFRKWCIDKNMQEPTTYGAMSFTESSQQ